MKIIELQLENFKFFDNLNIKEIPKDTEIVLLVGPNGTGKSCIFDAFNYFSFPSKRNNNAGDEEYYKKDKNKEIKISFFGEDGNLISQPTYEGRKINFYGRSSYRFTSKISRGSISTDVANLVLKDQDAPTTYSELDQRIENDIEKALGEFIQAVQAQAGKTDKEIVGKVIGEVNESLKIIFPDSNLHLVRIVDPHSDPISSKIDLEFSKDETLFSFRNLSSGEKEIVDIIFNFHRRKDEWIKNGIYFIDEPELHLNTKIQAFFLRELYRLCKKENAQLWVATHSLGFLRAAQDIKKENQELVSIIEFKYELSSQTKPICPILGSREDWKRIFQTALEDLTGLLAPRRIFYCEGRPDAGENNSEQGLDADIYNEIFFEKYPDVLFVSSGGGGEVTKNASLALNVLNKTFVDVELYLLKDRDDMTDKERKNFLDDNSVHRMLERREIENYIFDKEVLKEFCKQKFTTFNESTYDSKVTDINQQDLKVIQQDIQSSCGVSGDISLFKRNLAKVILKESKIYKDLSNVIF